MLQKKETLAEWIARTGRRVEPYRGGTICPMVEHGHEDYRALWHLSDYKVMSVISSVVYLSPVSVARKDGPIGEPHEPTPYQRHKQLGHKTVNHSPDGVDIVEECTECPMRWVHNPCIGYPVTMRPKL